MEHNIALLGLEPSHGRFFGQKGFRATAAFGRGWQHLCSASMPQQSFGLPKLSEPGLRMSQLEPAKLLALNHAGAVGRTQELPAVMLMGRSRQPVCLAPCTQTACRVTKQNPKPLNPILLDALEVHWQVGFAFAGGVPQSLRQLI